ncbi:MAG: TonB-dependent siderophore receptor [Pseudomonas sp.]
MTTNAPGLASAAAPLSHSSLRRNALFLPLLAALAVPVAAQAETSTDAKTLDSVQVTAEYRDGYTVRKTATATKLALSPLETPQSVSVISRQQIDDFALNNANQVLAQAAGVNVESVETERTYYSARGFDIVNFQEDGLGLPFANGASWGDIDTAIYERIEVLRGANGLLSSTGNPSATVNFVRKRPTEELQGNIGVSGGSWSNRRVDVDVSGKLNQSGSLRGRVVGAWQDGDSYLDRYSLDKKTLYGVIEADLSDSTLLTFGASYQQNKPKGSLWGALPLYYTDGTPTNYDRSTSTAADWSYWNTTDKRAFLELQQQLGSDWLLKASANYRKREDDANLYYVYNTPDSSTGLGLYPYPSHYVGAGTSKYIDAYLSGKFGLGGREHELVAGVNWGEQRETEASTYPSAADAWSALDTDLGSWDGSPALPVFDTAVTAATSANFENIRRTAYATVRWDLSDALKLITGVNHTQVESSGQSYGADHNYDLGKTTPFVGAVYNFDPNYALYASYAEIFNPQTELDSNFHVLDPVTGNNAELGIKGQWLDGRVNGSFAFFRAKQNGLADNATYSTSAGVYTYSAVDATSTGYEAEITGRLSDAWQINASYTQLSIKDADGQNARIYVPRRSAKLATTYRLPGLEQLKLGANVRVQSAIARDSGETSTSGEEIIIHQSGYALLGVMGSYDFTPHLTATLNLNNITDRKYINSLYWTQGFYGAGRNWWLSVNYRF